MGIVGGAVTCAAEQSGYDVYLVSRNPLKDKYTNLKVKHICGDWHDEKIAKKIMSSDYDIVIDSLIFNVEQLTRDINLIDGHCKQFIYISSDAVYNHPGHDVSEDNAINLDNLKWKYGLDKRLSEMYLEQNTHKYSFSWTVIRPTVTFGETRIPIGFSSRQNEWGLVSRIIKKKPIVMFDEEGSRHPICHVSTFGQAAIKLFLNESAYNNYYHISDDANYTYDQILNVVGEIVGEKPILVRVPVDKIRKLNIYKYDEMVYDKNPEFVLDNSKIKTLVDAPIFNIDLKNCLCETIKYLKDNSKNDRGDEEFELISDLLLLKYKRYNLEQKERNIVKQYISKLSLKYKLKILLFQLKRYIYYCVEPLYSSIKK